MPWRLGRHRHSQASPMAGCAAPDPQPSSPGVLLSGLCVERAGLGIIVWLNAGLLAVAAGIALRVPNRLAGSSPADPVAHGGGSWRGLLNLPVFTRTMGIVALVGGSHALHDGFEVLRWREAGLSASQASLLWSSSVAAEVVVFLFVGRWLLDRLGSAGALVLAAVAGVVRWTAAANTAAFTVMAMVEPLHGLTFALLHLACMDVIGRSVPRALAATAQAFYATVAMGDSRPRDTYFRAALRAPRSRGLLGNGGDVRTGRPVSDQLGMAPK